MKSKKVIITGGAGFIGSNLAEELSKGHEVIVIDDLSTGRRENIESLDIKFYLKPVHDKPRPGDIRHSLADIEKARDKLGCKPKYDLESGLNETVRRFENVG